MISLDKQYRTRDGREVRIYAVDCGGPWPVHGAHFIDDGPFGGPSWNCCQWATSGLACWAHVPETVRTREKTAYDLIEVRPKITRTYWMAHGAHNARAFQSERQARDLVCSGQDAVAITGPHTVEFTEGEGLHPQSSRE